MPKRVSRRPDSSTSVAAAFARPGGSEGLKSGPRFLAACRPMHSRRAVSDGHEDEGQRPHSRSPVSPSRGPVVIGARPASRQATGTSIPSTRSCNPRRRKPAGHRPAPQPLQTRDHAVRPSSPPRPPPGQIQRCGTSAATLRSWRSLHGPARPASAGSPVTRASMRGRSTAPAYIGPVKWIPPTSLTRVFFSTLPRPDIG